MEVFLTFLVIIAVFVFVILLACDSRQYRKGAYYQITKNPYSTVKSNKGRYAEYLTYVFLRHFENDGGKFLFNVFVPKGDDKVTEIDVLLINSKGLFVFECKNYSGWIFGNEVQKNWMQTLPQGYKRCRKEYFYNPIMQNASHIRHLKNLIGKSVPMWSIIVFSNRCALKSITIKSKDVRVTNHSCVASIVDQICSQVQIDIYTEMEINYIYNKLYPYTQFNSDVKQQYIESIKKRNFF